MQYHNQNIDFNISIINIPITQLCLYSCVLFVCLSVYILLPGQVSVFTNNVNLQNSSITTNIFHAVLLKIYSPLLFLHLLLMDSSLTLPNPLSVLLFYVAYLSILFTWSYTIQQFLDFFLNFLLRSILLIISFMNCVYFWQV